MHQKETSRAADDGIDQYAVAVAGRVFTGANRFGYLVEKMQQIRTRRSIFAGLWDR